MLLIAGQHMSHKLYCSDVQGVTTVRYYVLLHLPFCESQNASDAIKLQMEAGGQCWTVCRVSGWTCRCAQSSGGDTSRTTPSSCSTPPTCPSSCSPPWSPTCTSSHSCCTSATAATSSCSCSASGRCAPPSGHLLSARCVHRKPAFIVAVAFTLQEPAMFSPGSVRAAAPWQMS